MNRVEIRKALYGTRKVLVCDGGACRIIEPGVGPACANEIALKWGRIMGLDVIDRSSEPVDDLETARAGLERVRRG
jgi:hypothetical protein